MIYIKSGLKNRKIIEKMTLLHCILESSSIVSRWNTNNCEGKVRDTKNKRTYLTSPRIDLAKAKCMGQVKVSLLLSLLDIYIYVNRKNTK